jgi:hypothetical protein
MPNFWWCPTHHLYRGGNKRPCADVVQLGDVERAEAKLAEEQTASFNMYARVFQALGMSITAPWSGLADAALNVARERDALHARNTAALALHTEFKIYDGCDHEHTAEDVDAGRAINVYDVGYTCSDGYEYSICRHCCTGGSGFQSEECAGHSRPCWPCATVAALQGDQPAALSGIELRSVEERDDASEEQP